MEEKACRSCFMAKKARDDGTYLCEYYGLWVRGAKGCMAYVPKA
jgi:hypothetical protein